MFYVNNINLKNCLQQTLFRKRTSLLGDILLDFSLVSTVLNLSVFFLFFSFIFKSYDYWFYVAKSYA